MMCLLRLENLYLIYSTVNISCSYGSSGLQNNGRGDNVNHNVDQAWLPSVREQPSIIRIPFMTSR